VIDILWLIGCSGLVFLMQPGFMCLESGLTRSKNSINVAVKNLADFGISVALFWAFGYAVMFGASQAGWIGSTDFFFNTEVEPFLAAFFLFQAMFCSTATTIVSGAVAERMRFSAYFILAALCSGLIYPLFGHWVWNGAEFGEFSGWLGRLGFVDFAGSTVVHSVGGWIALATLLVVGPRLGRFAEAGVPRKIRGSNLPLSVLGAMLLWIGWIGFSGGSTFEFSDRVVAIILHTVLAGAAGMLAAATISWWRSKVPTVESAINGSIAGLVAITASTHAVSMPFAILIGAIGGAIMMVTSHCLERLRIDDAVDAVAVHVGAGIWGTLAVGLFGRTELLGTGLSRGQQILVQLLGIAICFIWAFGITFLLLLVLNRFFPLRVSPEAEEIGLNVSEHGAKTEAYDLFRVMEQHAVTQDLSLRVPVEPFTEVGYIAARYNQVMEAMEEAVTHTQAIVRTATDAIVTFTELSLAIITANPSAERLFGYSRSELQGMAIAQLLGEFAERTSDQRALLAMLLDKGPQEVVGCRADGSIFPLEVTIVKAELGPRSFYTGTFRDITERKQAEEAWRQKARNEELEQTLDELRHTQAQLIQSEKMSSLGQMVAGVAHEINNPVNFIYGNLTYAKDYTQDLLHLIELYQQHVPNPPSELQDEIDEIELEFIKEDFPKLQESLCVGAERIHEIVKSLRTFSRLDEAEVKKVDLHESLDSTLMILHNRLKATSDRAAIEILKDYGQLPLVDCYAGQLNQVFMNLLSNAIDALEDLVPKTLQPAANGKIGNSNQLTAHSLQIRIRTHVIDGEWVAISVADNGTGIAPEVREKIFDPFFTTKTVGKGTGLGLSISYQVVVERHGGKMLCYSEVGRGTEFVAIVPIEQHGQVPTVLKD